MPRAEEVAARLREALDAESVEVRDESARHAGHAEAKGRAHLAVRIVARRFAGRSPLERHRLVYGALSDLLDAEIHALSIRALAPGEPGAG